MASKSRTSDSRKGNNVTSQPPQWTEYLQCSICEKDFNRNDRCPISLGCGHTFCKACLGKLKQPQCQFDQTPITCNVLNLPINSALLQLIPGDSDSNIALSHHHSSHNTCDPNNISQYVKNYENAKTSIEELALYLKPGKNSELSRPMQRKLVALVNLQLCEEEGRKRAIRASRALGERSATELILLHQNPTTLSASLWAAVRARGCQFLGPAMQEEALKLIHLALEDRSELSRKVLVQIVVKNLQTQFSQASKTSIGHVVQLLYRASCFKVTKRDGESSLMRLKDEFLVYEDLRKEHDSQIVQIAREAGIRIAPDQWSALLYGDQVHKSYMQSIIDRLQSGASFQQCITDLSLALQRSNDPGNIQGLLSHFRYLSDLDTETSSWDALEKSTFSANVTVKELINFTRNQSHWLWQCQDATQQTSKYKTSMCRDNKNKGICPRGQACTFAHSDEELQHYRNRRKKGGQVSFNTSELNCDSVKSPDISSVDINEKLMRQESDRHSNSVSFSHTCQCDNTMNSPNEIHNPVYFHGQPSVNNHGMINHIRGPSLPMTASPQSNSNRTVPHPIVQQMSPVLPIHNIPPPPSQIQYQAKPHAYDAVHSVIPLQSSQRPCAQLPNVRVQNSPTEPMQSPVMQQSHYVVQQQHYCPVQPNSVQAVVPEHVPSNHHQSFSIRPYTCVTLQNGQQVALPTNHRPEMMQQSPVLVQQPPIPVQNLPPNQLVSYPPSVVMQVAPPPQPITNLVSPTPVSQTNEINNIITAVNSSLMVTEELPLMPNQPYNQCHLAYSQNHCENSLDLPSLAELRHRKDAVINKLVKKRIVAPKAEEHLQQKVASYYDLPDTTTYLAKPCSDHKDMNMNATKMSSKAPYNTTMVEIPSGNSEYYSKISCSTENIDDKVNAASGGRYSLWTGTTCIPSLSGLSFQDCAAELREQSSPNSIDVMSELDTRTSQVAAYHHEQNSEIYSSRSSTLQSTFGTVASHLNFSKSQDDDLVSIQDLRIVSKYGPIARTVRSKTTSAFPEQVTANANAETQPFPSDKNRNKSNFVAGDNTNKEKTMVFIRAEVEPTAVSVNSHKLPDLVSGSYTGTSSVSWNMNPNQMNSNDFGEEENEDLLLAIELQRIEMGIQRIQRDAKLKN